MTIAVECNYKSDIFLDLDINRIYSFTDMVLYNFLLCKYIQIFFVIVLIFYIRGQIFIKGL